MATINGTSGNDNLVGTDAADVLNGLDGDDTLSAGLGNDSLDGGAGSNVLMGGQGDDAYTVRSLQDVVVEAAGEGSDTVSSLISFTLAATLENLTLIGGGAINGVGNAGNNRLIGNTAANIL